MNRSWLIYFVCINFSFLNILFQNIAEGQPVTLENGDLKAVFVDNSAYGEHHLSGFNGISELYHLKQDSTLFVPLFAGVNLEHIFDGDSLVSRKEPRVETMSIERISDTKIILHQPKTSISKVENWTTFEMVDPHYIDVEFKFIVHDAEMFDHGYIGFFWASYINLPRQLGIFFKGRNKRVGPEEWMYVFSKQHGKNGTHISVDDTYDFYTAPNFNIDLAMEISDNTFTEPYYYGRFHNMVFAYLLPKPEKGIIRFSQSPSGAGDGMPAWDFQYLLPDFEVGTEYAIKWRVLYKEWQSQVDIEQEYEKWKSNQN